jgi:hypothetical protein
MMRTLLVVGSDACSAGGNLVFSCKVVGGAVCVWVDDASGVWHTQVLATF